MDLTMSTTRYAAVLDPDGDGIALHATPSAS